VPDVVITEFTDPACPWAYSAEPARRRIAWLYGDAIEWQTRMVVLAETAEQYESSGFTPERLSAAYDRMARDHGMPIDTQLRPRMAATLPACRAVVAARLHAPEAERAVLRALRVRNFAGELLDAPETIAGAARDAGLDPAALEGWTAGADVATALAADMAEARAPSAAARVLDHKLGSWPGGRRYTCPSYELAGADGVQISAPGFQPVDVYEVALANLLPEAERRERPADVADVLRWAGEPLATKEVAVVCGIDLQEAREALGRVATERHLGYDGLWSLD
jgi:predicted DsbA family dithiol-disulfide isomerase